jgi:hypothetical protein
MKIWEDSASAPEILLEPWNRSSQVVAISHVGADGLGNSSANALPRRQMQRLSDTMRNLTGRNDADFGLDTICVPPDTALSNIDLIVSTTQRLAKHQVFNKMRQIHEESTHIFVLDAGLMSVAVKGMGDVQKLVRIFCSAENSSLWTYQEGALAKKKPPSGSETKSAI